MRQPGQGPRLEAAAYSGTQSFRGGGFVRSRREAGIAASYVLVDEDGSILGRFNLPPPGRRGRGRLPGSPTGSRPRGGDRGGAGTLPARGVPVPLRMLKAATSDQNVASQRVLIKVGVVPAGAADPADIAGKQGSWYRRGLTAADS